MILHMFFKTNMGGWQRIHIDLSKEVCPFYVHFLDKDLLNQVKGLAILLGTQDIQRFLEAVPALTKHTVYGVALEPEILSNEELLKWSSYLECRYNENNRIHKIPCIPKSRL